jgi:hypothetical protein
MPFPVTVACFGHGVQCTGLNSGVRFILFPLECQAGDPFERQCFPHTQACGAQWSRDGLGSGDTLQFSSAGWLALGVCVEGWRE